MGGGLMQLVAYGAQDIYLTGNPQITFFKVVYRRHTNFSMECIKQSFKGTVGTGARVVATLARNGDLVHDCFIKVPSYTCASDTECNPGHNMIEYIECEIGGQLIDKHFGHWMEVHSQLTEEYVMSLAVKAPELEGTQVQNGGFGHGLSRFQLTSMAGGVLGKTSGQTLPDHFVPIRFWFCRHVGLSLPLIALQYHEVNINIKFSSAGCFSNDGTTPVPSLWCNYIYLDTDERRRFAQVSHEYLIEQVQHQGFTVNATGDTLKLNFNHPVKELIWAAIKTGAWGAATDNGGKFTQVDTSTTGDSTFQLKLNGHDRFEKQSATYFTRYQPLKYHTGLSRGTSGGEGDAIAVYSFALKPEEHQPSGTCNFSRIDNAQLLCQGEFATNLQLYALNYNVLRIMSGMGGLAYSN